jgi:autotransporter-associated beta strand protein
VTGAGAKTLTLQGSTASIGELAGAITNSAGGAISLLKTGTGAWILSGANSFTGTTTIYPGAGYNGTNETLILANLSGAAVQGNVIVDGSGGAVAGCAVLKMGAPNQFGANSVLVLTNVTLPRQSVVKLMGYDQTIAGLSAAALSNGQAIVENTENESNVVAEVTLTISNSTNYT